MTLGTDMPKKTQTFKPYEDLLAHMKTQQVLTWAEIQSDFLTVTSQFDTEYRKGAKTSGWYQAKARYFNDIIVTLLGNVSGKPMSTRRKKKSQLFNVLDIDVCYPDDGDPVIGAEVKALGTPPHPKNQMKARSARTDLHKRIREVAFTSIDFKVAYGPPKPIGSFQNWIDSSPPGYFTFWAMRVEDQVDFEAVRTILVNLRAYCNGVGAVVFMPKSSDDPTNYKIRRVDELDIDKIVKEIAQRVA